MEKHIFIVAGGPSDALPTLLTNRYADLQVENCVFVGVDAGAMSVLAAQLPLFLAIGDFDSLAKEQIEQIRTTATTMVELKPQKDDTDLEASLKWVLAAQLVEDFSQMTIHILNSLGGRIDHELAVLWLGVHPAFQAVASRIVIEDEMNVIRYFKPGKHTIDKLANMTYLSFICLTPIEQLTIAGVRYPLTNETVLTPRAFVSNEFLTDQMQLELTSGTVLMIQSRDVLN